MTLSVKGFIAYSKLSKIYLESRSLSTIILKRRKPLTMRMGWLARGGGLPWRPETMADFDLPDYTSLVYRGNPDLFG
jgi:hypothetical protein